MASNTNLRRSTTNHKNNNRKVAKTKIWLWLGFMRSLEKRNCGRQELYDEYYVMCEFQTRLTYLLPSQ